MPKILSPKEIFTTFALSKDIKYASIITFMLSTGIKSDDLVKLKIKDLLIGCGKDIGDEDLLKKLLDEDPLHIFPCWIVNNGEDSIKCVFNSSESSFYLFLYLKDRLDDINSYDEALFASNNEGKEFKAKSIREKLTKNFNVKQTSLINTFKNVCDNYITDDDVKKLFLGNPTNYNQSEESLKDSLNDALFKDKLIREYKKIMPHLTTSYYICENLRFYSQQENDGEDYKKKIKNYFDNNFKLHFRDLSDVDKGILLNTAYHLARLDKDKYIESDFYYNNLLQRAEITTVFEKSKYYVSEEDYSKFDEIYCYEHLYDELTSEERISLILDCFKELEISDKYNLDPKDIRQAVINQLSSYGGITGDFPYFAFEKVVLLSIFESVGLLE